MKKGLLTICACIVFITIQAQQFNFQVKLNPVQARSVTTLQQNDKIKVLSAKFENVELKQCYPGAKNPELLLYYTVRGKGNAEAAMKELKELYLFDEIIEEEPAHPSTCTSPAYVNDPQVNYGISLTETSCAWTISKGSPNIYIGVVDTEFDSAHEDLVGKFFRIEHQVPYVQVHGTRVAGVAAANTNNGKGISGYGYNSRIYAYGVSYNTEGATTTADIRDGIWHLYQNGVKIINISWTVNGLTKAAAEEITQGGTNLIVTAGNKVDAVQHTNIAEVPGVICVSSVNAENKSGPTNHARNRWVDICAPGVNIIVPKSNNTYGSDSGTSYAAPCVAGIISLMREVNPYIQPATVENIIKQTADPIADASLYPGLLGAGRINAYKAVMQAGIRSYINTTFTTSRYLTAGYGFTFRNVTIQNNAQINLIARKEVEINGPFEVALGSTLSIDISSTVSNNGVD